MDFYRIANTHPSNSQFKCETIKARLGLMLPAILMLIFSLSSALSAEEFACKAGGKGARIVLKGTDNPYDVVNNHIDDFVRRHMNIRLAKNPGPVFMYNTWTPFQRNISDCPTDNSYDMMNTNYLLY